MPVLLGAGKLFKLLAKSFQPNNQGTIMRCPLEEIGRNSESPWTMPRMTACKIGTVTAYSKCDSMSGLGAAHGHVANDHSQPGRMGRQPINVIAQCDHIKQHPLQRAGDREFTHRRTHLTIGYQQSGCAG